MFPLGIDNCHHRHHQPCESFASSTSMLWFKIKKTFISGPFCCCYFHWRRTKRKKRENKFCIGQFLILIKVNDDDDNVVDDDDDDEKWVCFCFCFSRNKTWKYTILQRKSIHTLLFMASLQKSQVYNNNNNKKMMGVSVDFDFHGFLITNDECESFKYQFFFFPTWVTFWESVKKKIFSIPISHYYYYYYQES